MNAIECRANINEVVSTTPKSDEALRQFDAFTAQVRRRLEAGRDSYGDASFELAPPQLSGEIEEELLDVLGWGFVLWCRMREIAARLPR